MGNVMVIPAKRQVGNTARQQDAKPKLRVAAYCRVSTDSAEQATSYDAQVEHYTELIQKNPEWEFAGIYADDGISGTNTKKREDFNRMIDDCEAGNIDMIITKSISRFARNTLDCLKYIRKLKDKNIPVFFEKEAINTMDAKGEVLITIMASLAQQNTADGIDERLQELQKELLKKANNKEAYDEIADEIFKLREQREKCTVDTAARDAQIARINELQDFIKQQPAHLEVLDEALVKRWLERIIVWEDHFTVELKSGLKIEIEG